MRVGDHVLAQLGELLRQRCLPEPRLTDLRRSLRRAGAGADARRERFAESLREGAERLAMTHAAAQLPVSISIRRPARCAADELAHVLARPDRLQGRQDRGRNRVEVYEQSDLSIVRRYADIGIAAKLREAIDAGRLHLYGAAHPALAAAIPPAAL